MKKKVKPVLDFRYNHTHGACCCCCCNHTSVCTHMIKAKKKSTVTEIYLIKLILTRLHNKYIHRYSMNVISL